MLSWVHVQEWGRAGHLASILCEKDQPIRMSRAPAARVMASSAPLLSVSGAEALISAPNYS